VTCWWCKRELKDHDTGRRVFIGFGTAWQCDSCWERDQEAAEVPLDNTEPEFDREGQPEFNGSFR
jgi:hypothetical protein